MPPVTIRRKEKRGHPRLRCTGTAELFTSPDAAGRKARILDLSASGCRRVMQEPLRLGLDSMVEVKFVVNQLPFRGIGQLKVMRSPTEIGILFPALSARVRLQVEDLVNELAEEENKRRAVFGGSSTPRPGRLA